MKVGLYFGSFNPIHIGHLIVADSMLEYAQLDEVWFVVSPQSPFKQNKQQVAETHRAEMVALATTNHPQLKVSTIEFDLPKPSYTIHTLEALSKQHPDYNFTLLMGSDNLVYFHKWKAYESILEMVHIKVYARSIDEAIPEQWNAHPKIEQVALPLIPISSTYLRNQISKNKSVRYWLRDEVLNFIEANNLYSE